MRKKLEIVITMSGLGKRFRDAGYAMPKYMIEAKGKTLFEWAMISLTGYMEEAVQFIFIALQDESYDVMSFIEEKCRQLQIKNYKIILLNYLTDGQATTALLAKDYWNKHNGLLIYNIDTYVESGVMNSRELRGDGFIPCFTAKGEHWSFVRLDDEGKVVEIKEKVRISNHCTLGAYYFRSCELYQQLYENFYEKQKNCIKGERYVAPLYDYLLKQGGSVYISNIPAKKVHVLGTPEELQDFIKV